MTLLQQIEAAFGTIQHGWTRGADGRDLPFQVIECRDGSGRAVFATLGLSSSSLWSDELGRTIRFELVIPALESVVAAWMPKLLTDFGSLLLKSGRPPLRGNFLELGALSAFGTGYAGVYFTSPIFLPEEARAFGEGEQAVVIVWCIPITAEESEILESTGWPALEARFAADPDILVKFRR